MHLRKLGGALLAVLALAAVLAACGGGGDSTGSGGDTTASESTESSGGEAPTKAAFIKEADKICGDSEEATNKEIVAYAEENKIEIQKEEPSQDQQLEIFEDVVLPSLSKEADEVGALTPPEGEEETVEDLVDTLNEEIGEVEEDPELLINGNPLEGASKKARAFGLKTCGN